MKKARVGIALTFAILAMSPLVSAEEGTCRSPAPGMPLELDGCKAGDTLILREVHFDNDSAKLRPESKIFLDQVARELKENPTIKVAIEGHTDNNASYDYNMNLSQNRANATRFYLVSIGVNPDQLVPKGYGFTQPIADNGTADGRALNRRVELKLVGTLVLAPAKPTKVYISTFHAKPQQLEVPVGTEVTWVNYDEISHDISFDGVMGSRIWTSPWLGNSYSLKFDQAGTYNYRCSVHKDVNGKIVVKPSVAEYVTTESPVYGGQTTSSYKAIQTREPYGG
ncbi:MAG: outer membrane protein OmpA-like peptidoglycan-associated protein/plastocyanin [Zhongshania aliphaticivorans]|jgi:outer membrane protein OmpA-like peptidoglycan-associated protein/plastocyanin|nr:OmpA family protein [Zhongshania aliphaticivorans]